jgi:hypothetical protein
MSRSIIFVFLFFASIAFGFLAPDNVLSPWVFLANGNRTHFYGSRKKNVFNERHFPAERRWS